jgi:hypothetical protein
MCHECWECMLRNIIFSHNWGKSIWFSIPYILLLYFLASFITANVASIFYPFALENGEGLILRYASLISDGKNIYNPIDGNDLLVGCNYPPFYLIVYSFLIKIFGTSFASGRSLCFFSTIGIGYLIYKFVLTFDGGKKSAILGALVFFSSPYINKMSIFARPHVFSVFLAYLGVYLITYNNTDTSANRKTTLWGLAHLEVFAITLLILATFTKQTAIWSSFAYFCWIVIWSPRRIISILAIFFIGILLTHGIATLITDGNYFSWVASYSVGEYSLKRLYAYWIFFLNENISITIPMILLFTAIIFIPVYTAVASRFFNPVGSISKSSGLKQVLLRFVDQDKKKLFGIYSFFVLLSCILVAREGSSVAYFTELIAIFSVWIGMGWFHLNLWLKDKRRFQYGLPIFFIILLGFHFYFSFELLKPSPIFFNQKTFLRDQKVIGALAKTPDFVLCEDQSYAILSNRQPYFVNPFIFTNMARRGLWNPQSIINDLQQGKVKAICTNSSIYKPNNLTTSRIDNEILEMARLTHKYELKIFNRYIYFYREADRSNAVERLRAMRAAVSHEYE